MSFKCGNCGKECGDDWAGCPWCLVKKPEFDYRLLKLGEVIQKGDEYWSLTSGKWVKAEIVGSVGETIVPRLAPYRRKIQKTVIHRSLEVDEIIQKDDQCLICDKDWQNVSSHSIGEKYDSTFKPVRRAITVYKDVNND